MGFYRLTDEDVETIMRPSESVKWRSNYDALRILKEIQATGREPTPEELSALARYVGFGGMPRVFLESDPRNAQLRALLTEDEYHWVRASVPNAHYTSPEVVNWMWQIAARLGFTGGRVVEPASGVGYFISLAPEDIQRNSEFIATDIDPIASAIARILFPRAKIHNLPFEQLELPDNSVDLFISNVPFGDYPIADPRYDHLRPSIHDYFFLKSVDKTRPGGLIIFVTSRFTMDRLDPSIRAAIAEKADLVVAFRLPATTFSRNARTFVTTDVIVLQKRAPGELPAGEEWLNVVTEPTTGIPINEYYTRHPENILGRWTLYKRRYAEPTPEVLEDPQRPLSQALQEALERVPEGLYRPATPEEIAAWQEWERLTEARRRMHFPVREGSFFVDSDGQVRQWRDGNGVPLSQLPKELRKAEGQLRALIELKDRTYEVIELQLENADDATLAQAQGRLQEALERYIQQYGHLSERETKQIFGDDPDYPLVTALEMKMEDPETGREIYEFAPLVRERVLAPVKEPERVADDPRDAYLQMLAWRGGVDLEWLEQKTGRSVDEWAEILSEQGLIFLNPDTLRWETREKYLSGFVRSKLRRAEEAAQREPRFARNVEALRQVQPKWATVDEFVPKLGATWIPTDVIKQFIIHLASKHVEITRRARAQITVEHAEGRWVINAPKWLVRHGMLNNQWGVIGTWWNWINVLERTLNGRPITVKRTDPVTKETYIDRDATNLARERQAQLRAAFVDFVRNNSVAREAIEEAFNEQVNIFVVPRYDGSHIELLPGANPQIRLYPHQKDAIWRIVQERRALLAHVVGAGKTYTMIGAAMELKRLGVIKKPMFVVPNTTVPQWRNAFAILYPSARVFAIDPSDFDDGKKRRVALSRIATGDYDAIIIAESCFGQIPVGETLLWQEKHQLRKAVDKALSGITDSELVKMVTKRYERLMKKIEKTLQRKRRDDVLPFEQLGVDFLFVDEAHRYKGLPTPTSFAREISGLDITESQRAIDLKMKINFLQRQYGGHVVFATGTPVTNTLTEAFVMLQYLAPDILARYGIAGFDDWVGSFAEAKPTYEFDMTGTEIRTKIRFSHYVNVEQLLHQWGSVADVRFLDDIRQYVKVPEVEKKEIIVGRTPSLNNLYELFRQRAEDLHHQKRPVKGGDNWLLLTNDLRKANLDPRMIDPTLPDEPGSKLNRAVEEVYRRWQEGKAERSVQIVFADFYQSHAPNKTVIFDIFAEMKRKLMERGVPEEEIVIANEIPRGTPAWNDFLQKANAGRVRIILATTQVAGEGLNIQQRLKTLHHLDVPWKPAWLEQREGRIVRQGNRYGTVEIVHYFNDEGGIESYILSTNIRKLTFIQEILRGKSYEQLLEDPASEVILRFNEINALITGRRELLELAKAQQEFVRLSSLSRSFEEGRARAQQQLKTLPDTINRFMNALQEVETFLQSHWFVYERGQRLEVRIGQRVFTDRQEALEALRALPQDKMWQVHIYGIPIIYNPLSKTAVYKTVDRTLLTMMGIMQLSERHVGRGPSYLIADVESELKATERAAQELRGTIENLENEMRQLQEMVQQPNPYAEQLAEAQRRVAELEMKLKEEITPEEESEDVALEDEEGIMEEVWEEPPEQPNGFPPGSRYHQVGFMFIPSRQDVQQLAQRIRSWARQWVQKHRRVRQETTPLAQQIFEQIEWEMPEPQRRKVASLYSQPGEPLTAAEELYTDIVDRFYPITKYSTALREAMATRQLQLPIKKDPVAAINDYYGATAAASQWLRDRFYPLLEGIVSHGELGNFTVYLTAMHAQELENLGMEHGLKGDLRATVREIEEHWENKGIIDEMTTAVRTWVAMNNELLAMLRDEGIISKEAFDTAVERWQFYVPFRRVMEEAVRQGIAPEGWREFDVTGQNVVLPIRGSQRRILNPYEVFVRKTVLAFNLIRRNRVPRLIIEAVEELRDTLEQTQTPEDDPLWDLVNLFRRRPRYITEKTEEGKIIREVRGRSETIHFYRNGKVQAYDVPADLAAALKESIDPTVMGLTVQLARLPGRLIRILGTEFNPQWWLGNIVRDQMFAAMTYPGLGYIPIYHAAQFWLRYLFGDRRAREILRDFYRSGAYAFTFFDDVQADFYRYRDALEGVRALNKPTLVRVMRKAGKVVLSPVRTLENVGRFMEIATRASVFARALEQGYSREEAARMAQEVTINFRRMGRWFGPYLSGFYPFVNARIQATRTLVSAATGAMRTSRMSARQVAATFAFKGLMFFSFGLLLYYFFNRRREGFWQLPQWAFYYDVPIFVSDDRYIRLPVDDAHKAPILLGMLMGMLMDREDPSVLTRAIGEAVLTGLLPFQSVEDIIPAPARGVAEQVLGMELFTRRQIVPEPLREFQPELQYTRRALPFFRALGEVLHVSPERLQTFAETHFGGLARIAAWLSPQEIQKSAAAWFKGLPAQGTQVRFIPVIGRFMGRVEEVLPPTREELERLTVERTLEARRRGYPLVVERYRIRAEMIEKLTRFDIERLKALEERDPEYYKEAVRYFVAREIQKAAELARKSFTARDEERYQLTQEWLATIERLQGFLQKLGWVDEQGRFTDGRRRQQFVEMIVSVIEPAYRTLFGVSGVRQQERMKALAEKDPQLFLRLLMLGWLAGHRESVLHQIQQLRERDPTGFERMRQHLSPYLVPTQ